MLLAQVVRRSGWMCTCDVRIEHLLNVLLSTVHVDGWVIPIYYME